MEHRRFGQFQVLSEELLQMPAVSALLVAMLFLRSYTKRQERAKT